MSTRLIIEGNSVYEIDEECLACSQKMEQELNESLRRPGERIEHKGAQARRDKGRR